MSTKPIIHFYVDTSFKMHMKTSEGLTAMEKVAKFLLHFCRRNDKQAAYFSRVRIHFGKTLVQLKTGKAEKMLHEYIKNMTKRADILDPITFWKEAVESDTCNSTFFVLTTCVDAKTLNLLFPFRNSLFFMDFGGKPNLSFKDRVKFVKISDIQKDADDIHEMHLQDYLTRVNFGVPFHAEFHTVNAKDKRQISFSDIKIVATTLSGPLEGTTVLASSLLFPVNNCYHVAKGNKIKNVAAYHLLKELLGEESKYNKSVKSAKIEEPDSSERAASPMDTSGNTEEIREEDEESPKRLARKAKTNEVLPQFLLDRQSGLGEADEGDDADDDNDGNAVDDEPSTPAKKKAKRPKADSDEDEEYTPTKKSRKTAKTTPTRGGKRGGRVAGGEKIATPKRATRSAARGRGRPKKLGAGTREEAHEILPENIKKEPREEPKEEKQEQEEKEDTPTDKTPKPVSDTLFYVACGTERWTNVRRPVVLRLRGLYDQDKKFYDEETLKKMTVALEEESPASPAQSQDGPASPDMAPTTLQPVKTIPTTPQVPPDFCQPASPQSPPRNDDTKEPSIVAIPLEPTAAESVDMGQPASPTMDDEDGKNKSCIAEEPEEIAESVKCIPVESEAERELKKSQKDNNKYIEIIVLDMTWSQFENQVALVGDEAAIAEITEREKKVLGPEQSHDYTKLTGWYSPDSMFFYISKVVRALRKLQDRSAIFEKEIENMGRMVVYGQSPEYARQFALFLREEAYTIRPQLIPIVESAAGYFDQLCAMYELQTSKRNNLSVKDK